MTESTVDGTPPEASADEGARPTTPRRKKTDAPPAETRTESATKPKTKAKKRRNATKPARASIAKRPFPKVTLQEALRVAQVIKEKNGGNAWDSKQVAEALGVSAMGNAFFYLAGASRDFGLTEGSRDTPTISLTKLGAEIVYAPNPAAERASKIKAFQNIELFQKVLTHYNGTDLPEMKYLGNTLEKQFKLALEYHEEFSQVFRENARYLGIGAGFLSRDGSKPPPPSSPGNGQPAAIVTLAEPTTGTKLRAFVVMPFSERENVHALGFFQEVLQSLITPAARDAGFLVQTANRQGSDIIQSTIINDLLDADLVIADLTEHNPNVLFELGVRMARDKPFVLIKAIGTGRIFDIDNMLRVYEYDPKLWRTTIEKDLPAITEHIRGAWETRESAQSYMKVFARIESGVVQAVAP
jgi:hypothetical protein